MVLAVVAVIGYIAMNPAILEQAQVANQGTNIGNGDDPNITKVQS